MCTMGEGVRFYRFGARVLIERQQILFLVYAVHRVSELLYFLLL